MCRSVLASPTPKNCTALQHVDFDTRLCRYKSQRNGDLAYASKTLSNHHLMHSSFSGRPSRPLHTYTQGSNLNLTLIYMRSKTMVSYMSKNGLVANNLQVEEGDLEMAVATFSVPAGVASDSCGVTLYHSGALQQSQDENLK